MNWTTTTAGIVVLLAGLWLVGLAFISAFAPQTAARFLSGFAATARAHVLEQILRIIAGAGFVVFAAEMRFAQFFHVFGWVLILTSAGLLIIPWRIHNRFAQKVVPLAIRHLKVYAAGAALLALVIFYAML